MARLTAAERRRIPKSKFGVPSKAPGSGSFPITDKGHARAAEREIGHASPAERPGILRKAHAMLGQKSTLRKAMGRMKAKGAFLKVS